MRCSEFISLDRLSRAMRTSPYDFGERNNNAKKSIRNTWVHQRQRRRTSDRSEKRDANCNWMTANVLMYCWLWHTTAKSLAIIVMSWMFSIRLKMKSSTEIVWFLLSGRRSGVTRLAQMQWRMCTIQGEWNYKSANDELTADVLCHFPQIILITIDGIRNYCFQ